MLYEITLVKLSFLFYTFIMSRIQILEHYQELVIPEVLICSKISRLFDFNSLFQSNI